MPTRNQKHTFRHTIKRFFEPVQYTKKYYKVMIPLKIFEAILIVMSMNMLKLVTEYITTSNENGIRLFLFIYGGCVIIYFALLFLFKDYDNFIYIVPNYYLTKKNLEKSMIMENTYYEKLGTGKLIEISKGVLTRSAMVTEILTTGVGSLFTILFSVITIIFIDVRYCIFLVLAIGTIGIVYYVIYPHTKKIQKQRKEIRGDVSRFVVKFFMSKNEILTQGRSEEEFRKLFALQEREKENIHQRNRYTFRVFRFPDFIVYGLQIIIALVFGIGAIRGTNSIGDYAMFVGLLLIIQKATLDILKKIHNIDFESVHIQKLRETFDEAPCMDVTEGKNFVYKSGDIQLAHVTFGYEKKNTVFKDFSLTIQGGKKTAFVGPSGGGKTTLIK